jgi:hypothetical protein
MVSNLLILIVTLVVSIKDIVSICVIYFVSVTSEITSVSEILLSLLMIKYTRAIVSTNINMFCIFLMFITFYKYRTNILNYGNF